MAAVFVKLVARLLIFLMTVTSSAQQSTPPSRQEVAVRARVARLSPETQITVIPLQVAEEFGEFVSSTDADFTFFHVDRKSNVTLQYSTVRKIKEGYCGYNSFQHRHTDRTRGLIVVAVAIGVLGGLIAAVAVAKN